MVHNFTCRTVCNIFGVLICSFGGCIISSTFILLPPSELSLSFFCIFAFCLNNFLKKICDRLINWHSYIYLKGLSWSWSYGSWIYNYLCYQCLSPLTLWVWMPLSLVVFKVGITRYIMFIVFFNSHCLKTKYYIPKNKVCPFIIYIVIDQ